VVPNVKQVQVRQGYCACFPRMVDHAGYVTRCLLYDQMVGCTTGRLINQPSTYLCTVTGYAIG
jgi:hypothetical protein